MFLLHLYYETIQPKQIYFSNKPNHLIWNLASEKLCSIHCILAPDISKLRPSWLAVLFHSTHVVLQSHWILETEEKEISYSFYRLTKKVKYVEKIKGEKNHIIKLTIVLVFQLVLVHSFLNKAIFKLFVKKKNTVAIKQQSLPISLFHTVNMTMHCGDQIEKSDFIVLALILFSVHSLQKSCIYLLFVIYDQQNCVYLQPSLQKFKYFVIKNPFKFIQVQVHLSSKPNGYRKCLDVDHS